MFALWVDPAHRRKGTGQVLIEYAKTWAQPRGVSTLKVGVFDDNLGALRLYKAAGFQDLGETNPERSIPGRPGRQLSMDLA